MLQITKKAATEAECEAILAASYADEKPFGKDVIFINAADFRPTGSLLSRLFQRSVQARVEDYILNKRKILAAKNPLYRNSVAPLHLHYGQNSPSALTGKLVKDFLKHNQANGVVDDLSDPSCPIVAVHAPFQTGKVRLHHSLGIKQEDVPGFDAQWHTAILWHEIAHVLGHGESKADQISSMVCRYGFEDTRFLSFKADMRILKPVLSYDKRERSIVSMIGLPDNHTVDLGFAIDSVVEAVQDPRWKDIERAISQKKAASRVFDRPTARLASQLKEHVPRALKARDLAALADCAERLVSKGDIGNNLELILAKRFAVAAQRLLIGTLAYHAGTPPSPLGFKGEATARKIGGLEGV